VGTLDAAAIERVRDEERPDPRDADELHDALLTTGFLLEDEVDRDLFAVLECGGRATAFGCVFAAAERLPELQAIHDIAVTIKSPPSRAAKPWTREQAIIEILRGRLAIAGPTTAKQLADSLAIEEREANHALIALESEGVVLRGTFSAPNEWCDRRLLARIHRYTLNRLRAEIEPVTASDFTRFLFAWQHATPSSRLTGIDGLRAIVAQLDGFEVAASAWERAVLPQRIDRYDASMLDTLSFAGEVGWARLSASATMPVAATPIALFLRENADAWQAMRSPEELVLSDNARRALELLQSRGASFSRDIADDVAIAELVSAGLVASDGFAGLRALIGSAKDARFSGRWSLLRTEMSRDDAVELQARALLRRYGVVFRRLLTREANAAPWRELARVYRRLEARGEIRGGRFVTGMSGEQFALPDAVEHLREVRREPHDGRVVVISAADPLNLAGILTTGERVRAVATNRIAYRDGIAISAMEGDYLRPLHEDGETFDVAAALAGRRVPVAAGFVGRTA
ncbi:MAG TPA: ATP-dependent DNA helicase, partial [Thermoanaerobaculia bacterium]|nr:ATP-dependent DNA helicase [Thermoanaerobaculia bacterium]